MPVSRSTKRAEDAHVLNAVRRHLGIYMASVGSLAVLWALGRAVLGVCFPWLPFVALVWGIGLLGAEVYLRRHRQTFRDH